MGSERYYNLFEIRGLVTITKQHFLEIGQVEYFRE